VIYHALTLSPPGDNLVPQLRAGVACDTERDRQVVSPNRRPPLAQRRIGLWLLSFVGGNCGCAKAWHLEHGDIQAAGCRCTTQNVLNSFRRHECAIRKADEVASPIVYCGDRLPLTI
jgi:hypothetical protein